jgi:quercetin dioxygenase-like cupin family protein
MNQEVFSMRTFAALLLLTCAAWSQQPADTTTHHQFVTKSTLQWSAMAIPHLEMAVISGDPKVAGPFVIRIRAAHDQEVPAHWHPADEHVTVIGGMFGLGTGERFEKSALRNMAAGDYVRLSTGTRHFAWFKKDTVVQLHGEGPFVINWVDPEAVKALQAGTKK